MNENANQLTKLTVKLVDSIQLNRDSFCCCVNWQKWPSLPELTLYQGFSDALYVDKVNTNQITDISVKFYLYLYKKERYICMKTKVYSTRIKYIFFLYFVLKTQIGLGFC